MADEKEDDCVLHTLTKLAEACKAAPRFGKNGRELVLAAVDSIDDDFVFEPSPPVQSTCQPLRKPDGAEVHSTPSFSKPPLTEKELFKAIPPLERPYVQYKIGQKVPKITRQTEVNQLAGKYLCLLLQKLQLKEKMEWIQAVEKNEQLRAAAVEAANRHEADIYAKTYNETNYVRTIRAAQATAGFVDDNFWKGQTMLRIDSINSSLEGVVIASASDNGDAQAAADTTKDAEMGQKSMNVSSTDRDRRQKRSLSGESTTSPAPRQDDSVGGTHDDDVVVERSLKQPRTETNSQPHLDSHNDAPHESSPLSPSDKDHVHRLSKKRQQLLTYIKTILDPFFAARLIDRETYKRIAGKVLAKVLAAREKEETADFILSDGMRIRRLIEEYIRFYKKERK